MNENYLIGTIGGAVGGLVTLGGKFVLDRITERYKATIALGSKRHEKYYDKQASAISGTYERLARCAYNIFLGYPAPDADNYGISESSREFIRKAQTAADEFEDFLETNRIYFTRSAAEKVDSMFGEITVAIIAGLALDPHETMPPEKLQSFESHRAKMENLLEGIQDEFRNLMLNDVQA